MKEIVINNIRTSYYITEEGKCYNSKTNKYLKGQENYKNGYFSYNLTMPDGSKKRCLAHRLVAMAFIPNNDSEKNQINHIVQLYQRIELQLTSRPSINEKKLLL